MMLTNYRNHVGVNKMIVWGIINSLDKQLALLGPHRDLKGTDI